MFLLVGCIDGPEARLDGLKGQRRGAFLLPSGAVEEPGHNKLREGCHPDAELPRRIALAPAFATGQHDVIVRDNDVLIPVDKQPTDIAIRPCHGRPPPPPASAGIAGWVEQHEQCHRHD